MKIKLGDIDGLEREAQDRISHGGKNIDSARSRLNLYVHGLDGSGNPVIKKDKFDVRLRDRIMKRILDAGAHIRKDNKRIKGFSERGKNTKESVVAEGIELQVSHQLAMRLLEQDGMLDSDGKIRVKDLPRGGKTFQFFSESYLFLCKKWGHENIVGGYIHLDEYTPHMHVFVVPVVIKLVKYRGEVLMDQNGYPKKRASLNAKSLFSRATLRRLWEEYGSFSAKFGATKAKGLAPKGAYDAVATMDALFEQKQGLLNQVEDNLKRKRGILEAVKMEIEDLRKKAKELERRVSLLGRLYSNVIAGIQKVFDAVGEGSYIVYDYDVLESTEVGYSPLGEKTQYIHRTYTVMAEREGKHFTVKVDQDDYYNCLGKQSGEKLRRKLSRFFFDCAEAAVMAKEMKVAVKSANQQFGNSAIRQ